MADYLIGDNLYADPTGKYYRMNNGAKAYEASPYDEMTNKLNSIYDNQRKTQLEQLKNERARAVTGYNQQKNELKPKFQNQRNQADVVNAQNVSRLRELMAAQGINASGENLTTQASMASSRQGAFNEINQAENQVMGDIDRQIAEVNDPSKELAITNSIELERSKALADTYRQYQQEVYQRYLDWRDYQMQQAQLAASQARSSGGSGGRRKSSGSSSGKATTTKAASPAPAVKQQSILDEYYSSPAIQAVERLKSMSPNNYALNKAFDSPVPPAQNPNLSAWAKMRMFGK